MRVRYIQQFVDRKSGSVFHYFRRAGFPRVRLPGLPGSREFMAAYQDALEQQHVEIGAKRSKPGTVAAAVAAHFVSPQFTALAEGTRAARRQILQRFRDEHGDRPIGNMPTKFIALVLSTKKPHAARNWFKAIRALCQFAVAVEMIAADPTHGVKPPKVKTERHRPWTESEIEEYKRTHPVGSKARLAFALGFYTVQRKGDVIRMGRQHIRDGVLTVRQSKTGKPLALPIDPELQTIINTTSGAHMTFLVTRSGRPYSGSNFSAQFRAWCDEAGLPKGCAFHGLRATGCTRLADAQCTTHEIAAWSGHVTLKEVQHYTESANQKRLAVSAMARIANR